MTCETATFLRSTPLWRADDLAVAMQGAGNAVCYDPCRLDFHRYPHAGTGRAVSPSRAMCMTGMSSSKPRSGEAAAAVIDEAHAGDFPADAPLIIVDDVLKGLERLGRAARRARHKGPAIAVTGSVGKTSTKEMLRVALSGQGKVHASVASYNNHWGVPLTLSRMPVDTDFGVFEIGMSNPYEILPLTAMVRPHVAIVTTVEPVHLAQFRAIEGIADAKGEIFSGWNRAGSRSSTRITRMPHALPPMPGRVARGGSSGSGRATMPMSG